MLEMISDKLKCPLLQYVGIHNVCSGLISVQINPIPNYNDETCIMPEHYESDSIWYNTLS